MHVAVGQADQGAGNSAARPENHIRIGAAGGRLGFVLQFDFFSRRDRLESVAARKKIKLQHEAQSATSGTDTDVIFWTRGGIPSALVSLPNRYMHSPVEVISLKDLAQIPELLAGFALSVKKNEEFKVVV